MNTTLGPFEAQIKGSSFRMTNVLDPEKCEQSYFIHLAISQEICPL